MTEFIVVKTNDVGKPILMGMYVKSRNPLSAFLPANPAQTTYVDPQNVVDAFHDGTLTLDGIWGTLSLDQAPIKRFDARRLDVTNVQLNGAALETLEGFPDKVWDLDVTDTQLKDLRGVPQELGDLRCNAMTWKSLPRVIHNTLYVRCQETQLKGFSLLRPATKFSVLCTFPSQSVWLPKSAPTVFRRKLELVLHGRKTFATLETL